MAWALRSVMSRLAAMARSRAPGSWAMHSSTRAWLVRKPQLVTLDSLPHFLEIYCWFLVANITEGRHLGYPPESAKVPQGHRREPARGYWPGRRHRRTHEPRCA